MKIIILMTMLLFFQELTAETVRSESFTGNAFDEHVSNGEMLRQQCRDIENKFHDHIKKILNTTQVSVQETADCLSEKVKSLTCDETNKNNLALLEKNRGLLKKLFEEIALDFVKKDPNALQNLTKQCILGTSGKVQFEKNIRMLRPQLQPAESCQGVLQRWWNDLDQTVADKLSGKIPVTNLTAEEVKSLSTFHQSPLKRMIDTNAIYEISPPPGELKKQLAIATNKMAKGVLQLKQRVEGYKESERYKLYIYSNQFDLFVHQQNIDANFADKCKKSFCVDLQTIASVFLNS